MGRKKNVATAALENNIAPILTPETPLEQMEIKGEGTIDKNGNIVSDIVSAKKVESKKEDIVQISRKDFDLLMGRIEKLTTDQTLLFQASDKSRLAKLMNADGKNLIKNCKIRTWDRTGKFIIATKLITNRCEVIMGKWVEDQTITMILEDGETITVPYLEYVRKTLIKVPGDIIGKTEEFDSEGEKAEILKIQFADGKQILINSKFVN